MSKRVILWLLPILLYLAFVAWYTDLGGPLKPTEITAYSEKMRENGVSEQRMAKIREFMQAAAGAIFAGAYCPGRVAVFSAVTMTAICAASALQWTVDHSLFYHPAQLSTRPDSLGILIK